MNCCHYASAFHNCYHPSWKRQQTAVGTTGLSPPPPLTMTTTTRRHHHHHRQQQHPSNGSSLLFSIRNFATTIQRSMTTADDGDDDEALVLPSSSSSVRGDEKERSPPSKASLSNILWLYVNALRPITITQAVGALMVGFLSITSYSPSSSCSSTPIMQIVAACWSVYLSYGAGMVMNDCVDMEVDAMSTSSSKQSRAIASGRISKQSAQRYVGSLSAISLILAYQFVNVQYTLWSASNLIMMIGYALSWQRILLVKNLICGWLAISPLIGASMLNNAAATGVALSSSSASSSSSLLWLAAVGLPIHVAREIVKDIEDVDIDKRGGKQTLPIVLGTKVAHRIAYGIVGIVCSMMIFTPIYWNIFGPSYVYTASVVISVPMCIRASIMSDICKGQKLLKKSIYVLLAGMISGLLMKK